MGLCVSFKARLSLNRAFDFRRRDPVTLRQAARQDSRVTPMKAVQDAIVDVTGARSQFVDAVPEVIGNWTTKLVTQPGKLLDECRALDVGPSVAVPQIAEPVNDRDTARTVLIENDPGLWHTTTP